MAIPDDQCAELGPGHILNPLTAAGGGGRDEVDAAVTGEGNPVDACLGVIRLEHDLGAIGDEGRAEQVELAGGEEGGGEEGRIVLAGGLATLPLREARELFEREYLLTQINRFGGNISRTASFVGMERSALHRKLKSLGVVTTNKAGGRVAYIEGDEE